MDHKPHVDSHVDPSRLPSWAVGIVLCLCVAPLILTSMGVDFATAKLVGDAGVDQVGLAMRSAFSRTVLEWSALSVTVFTGILAALHYGFRRDSVMPVMGLALFCAGSMDALHTLTVDRSLSSVGENANLIPTTWAICRFFNGLILVLGAGLFIGVRGGMRHAGPKMILGISAALGFSALLMIHYGLHGQENGEPHFLRTMVTRPWDLGSLVVFGFAGLVLLPMVYRHQPNVFIHALALSMVPQVATQLHMAFGSTEILDHHYNVAQGLRFLACLIPFIGLCLLFRANYRAEALRSEQLETTRDEALAAVTARSEFLANMSHEIRTPMTGVVGMTALLLETELNKTQREYTEVVRSSADALLVLINDILDFSKIDAGKMSLEVIDMDLRASVGAAIDILAISAQAKGLTLALEFDEQIPVELCGDAGRLRQVLTNLVGNAIKFTDRGIVQVKVRLLEDSGPHAVVEFRVRDEGIGISPAGIELLFQPFVQADASTTRKFGGTGLGLTIARQLTQLMDGDIEVQSTEGQGSTFLFTARFARGWLQGGPQSYGKNHGARELEASLQGLRVLLAEDNMVNQRVALQQLKKLGCSTDVVGDGLQALERLRTGDYDLVLMDCQMPELDGMQATRQLREMPGPISQIPVIAMTANAMVGDREKCLDAGMNDYISKPVSLGDLAEKLVRWSAARRARSVA